MKLNACWCLDPPFIEPFRGIMTDNHPDYPNQIVLVDVDMQPLPSNVIPTPETEVNLFFSRFEIPMGDCILFAKRVQSHGWNVRLVDVGKDMSVQEYREVNIGMRVIRG